MRETKEKKEEIIWDKKKIIITLIIVILLLGIGLQLKSLFLGGSNPPVPKEIVQKEKIKGINIGDASQNLSQSFQERIESLKKDAQNLNIAEVASSSPQVQKILNDLKSLKDLPKNQLKDACEKVCGGL